jgi:hypothetical protein
MGATGSMITLHALGTSTSWMVLRFSLLEMDLAPKVATSLEKSVAISISQAMFERMWAYQTVATPCSGDVSTITTQGHQYESNYEETRASEPLR